MTTARTIDFKKVHKALYTATASPALLDAPQLAVLAVDGVGDPSGTVYREAVEALYGVSYALRFALKKAGVITYPVMPLEGLWWGSEDRELITQSRDTWNWTMLIMQPPDVTRELAAQAIAATAKKKATAALQEIRLQQLTEGRCAQILHSGPYSEEAGTVDRLVSHLHQHGYQISGKHHEIYLSNPTRSTPDKLRTIIRYPVSVHRSSARAGGQ
ncbi:GyrI-like domain-containing protein [Streptomyces sp. NPDC050485]|uniref:GyrI-like domain-containing protein n=1 Tax=Streptomyces sp. NPDC050485 TaxID=3365617 RepID=UPI00378727AF